jgi:hypothetical protein
MSPRSENARPARKARDGLAASAWLRRGDRHARTKRREYDEAAPHWAHTSRVATRKKAMARFEPIKGSRLSEGRPMIPMKGRRFLRLCVTFISAIE